MMKSVVCFAMFALIAVNALNVQLTDRALEFLAKVKLEDLPESVRLGLLRGQARDGDSSHWCCINEQPAVLVTETKIEYRTKIVYTKTKVGYVPCGVMGLERCSHYVTVTRAETESFIQTFQVPNTASCSSHEVKCCSGYINVANNCHALAELLQHQELFQMLTSLGLLTSPAIGK